MIHHPIIPKYCSERELTSSRREADAQTREAVRNLEQELMEQFEAARAVERERLELEKHEEHRLKPIVIKSSRVRILPLPKYANLCTVSDSVDFSASVKFA